MDQIGAIKERVRNYILREFLPRQRAGELTDTLSLVETGIIDSLGALKMFAFIEEEFDIDIEPEDVLVEHLGTVGDIAKFVAEKWEPC
ncbi:MAG: acyl carrier protein [Nannocystaceae bacterium]